MINADRMVGDDLHPRIKTRCDLGRKMFRMAWNDCVDLGTHLDDLVGGMFGIIPVYDAVVISLSPLKGRIA